MQTYISAKMIERLLVALAELGVDSAAKLAEKKVGPVNYNTAYQIFEKRAKSMDCKTLADILTRYPSINANYVLIGSGSPTIEPTQTDDMPTVYVVKSGNVRVEIREDVG